MSRCLVLDPSVVVSFCLIFALTSFLPQTLNDSDTLWQIATGGWILDHRATPSTDPFSFAGGDQHWFAHEWLAETLMAVSFRVGGLPGVMVLTGLAAGLTAALLMQHLRRFLPGIYATAGLSLAFYCAAPSLLARPHLLAWPCLALWCNGLAAARASGRAPSAALLPVMLVWVNLHGSFMFGLLLPAAFLMEALLEPKVDRLRIVAAWIMFMMAAWAVALINPDFAAGVVYPFHLISMSTLPAILEWQPPDFSRLPPVEVMICGALALGLSGRLRLPPVRLVMLLGLFHMAMAHARYAPLLGIVGAFVLAEPFGAGLHQARDAVSAPRAWRLAGIATTLAIALLCLRFVVPLGPERSQASFASVLQRVPRQLREQPVLNEYGIGGRLIFAGVRPFIDGRADLYGDDFVRRYHQIAALDHAAFARAVAEYAIAWTMFPANDAIVAMLDHEPGWHRLVSEGGFVIHARS